MLLQPESIEAKRRKHKGSNHPDSHRTKTKTKWSTSTDLGGSGNAQVASEEHGYYVKRTYSPLAGANGQRKSPPYLAIPIAWFGCEAGKEACQQATSNSAAINSPDHALSEGYLCDDDCEEGYEPICGQTPNEVAVFYNKCKLNVAKCRTHGLWTDLPYEQCKETYAKETAYTDKKFRCSPFFRDNSTKETLSEEAQKIEHDQIETEAETETETETETEAEKDKDSNESSEEEQDKKEDKKQNKKENKKQNQNEQEETVEPIALPLPSKPAEIPVPASIETIALPPLPVKTTPEQQPEPILVKIAETKPEKQHQPEIVPPSEAQTEIQSQHQIDVQTKPQIQTPQKPQIQTPQKPQIQTPQKPQIATQTKPQIQAKPQTVPALIQSQIQQQVQQHIQSQIQAQKQGQTEKKPEIEKQTEIEAQTENKAQTENLIPTEEQTQPKTEAQLTPIKTVEHQAQAAKVTKPLDAAIVAKDKLKYVVS